MAKGAGKYFTNYELFLGRKVHDNSTDQFNYVFITESLSSIDANLVAAKLSDFTEVAISGNYIGATQIQNTTYTATGGVVTLTGDSSSFAPSPSNPVTAKTLLIYNETDTGKSAVAAFDMTIDDGITAADTTDGFNYNINAGGIVRDTTNV